MYGLKASINRGILGFFAIVVTEFKMIKKIYAISCVHIYFLDSCRMELAMNIVFGLNVCLNARFILKK